MSIRRPRGPKPILKHLAFLEAMIAQPERSAESHALRASLLTLRLFDEWVVLGEVVADGGSPALRAARSAVDALHEDKDLQFLLTRVLDGILMLRDPDAGAVLPRLEALADLYDRRNAPALAADVRQSLDARARRAQQGLSALTPAIA